MVDKKNTSPKHKIEILSTDEGKEKMFKVSTNKTREYILKYAAMKG